ncbi:MAG: hypothetical protein IKA80_07475 [Spirochaetaceae bacterium]|nr:hypothetical protein [Spirochaetaceae bacterium]
MLADQMGSATFGFSLDLPEGFVVTENTGDGRGYQFKHQFCSVEIIIRIYETKRYQSAQAALEDTLRKLSVISKELDKVEWRQTDCSLAQFQIQLGNQTYGGRGVAVELPEQKGWFTMLSYAPTSDGRGNNPSFDLDQLIVSVIDSLSIDRRSQFGVGPVTAYILECRLKSFPRIKTRI